MILLNYMTQIPTVLESAFLRSKTSFLARNIQIYTNELVNDMII
jgi:hypothetical protein